MNNEVNAFVCSLVKDNVEYKTKYFHDCSFGDIVDWAIGFDGFLVFDYTDCGGGIYFNMADNYDRDTYIINMRDLFRDLLYDYDVVF